MYVAKFIGHVYSVHKHIPSFSHLSPVNTDEQVQVNDIPATFLQVPQFKHWFE